MLTDSEKAAVLALLSKYVRFYDESAADRQIIAEAQGRLTARQPHFEKLKAAFSLFGYEVKTEEFARMKEDVGAEAYYKAHRDGGRLNAGPAPAESGSTPTPSNQDADEPVDATKSIRLLVLDELRKAHPRGLKALEIRKFVEAVRGEKLHDKTIGMTLYRLSNEHVARREGRTWFFVPSGTKNPGTENAGAH